MKIFVSILLIPFFLSCSTNQMRKKITGCWVIDDVVVENTSYPKGNGFLLLNILCLNENNECRFPRQLYSNEEQNGTWKIFKKNDVFFLKITDCEDNYFNDDYQIELKDVNGDKASFKSKKMEFHCTFEHMIGSR